MRILVFGDAHVSPDETPADFERFHALGRLIAREKPDVVVCLGDLGDFRSLLAHRGATLMGGDGGDQGLDLLADIDAWRDALRAITAPYRRDNERHLRARRRDRIYEPALIFCAGNHEEKIAELGRRHPVLRSIFSPQHLRAQAEQEGWRWVPFLAPAVIEDVVFRHYHPAQVRKNALPIDRHLGRGCESSITGHTHIFQLRSTRTAAGEPRAAIVAGCFKPPRRLTEYEEAGALMLRDVRAGSFRFEWMPLAHIAREFRPGSTSRGTP